MKKLILTAFVMVIILLSGSICKVEAQFGDAPPPDRFYETDRTDEELDLKQREAVELIYVREADIMYSKRLWQDIDFREKINQTLYYPKQEVSGKRNLTQILYDAVREGSIRAYDGHQDDFTIMLTPDEVMDYLEETRTMTLDDGTDTSYTISFDPADVTRLRVKEDWFIDQKRSLLDVRIIGVSPRRERFDVETGEFIGFEPIFWVYFPEARNILINEEVYNRHSDAARISFDDLFLRRMFNSYAVKESNVYDRMIQDYYTGLDALLEAERVFNEVRYAEHDLWEF